MLLFREIRQRPNSSSRRAAIGREKDKRMSLTRKTLYIGFAALLAFALLL